MVDGLEVKMPKKEFEISCRRIRFHNAGQLYSGDFPHHDIKENQIIAAKIQSQSLFGTASRTMRESKVLLSTM